MIRRRQLLASKYIAYRHNALQSHSTLGSFEKKGCFHSVSSSVSYASSYIDDSIHRQTPLHKRSPYPTSPLHLHTSIRTKVFVSKHNQSLNVAASQITEYCSHHGISSDSFRKTTSHVVLKECPFCPKPHQGKADNLFKIYIKIGGGAYFCHRCGAKGSWYDFKMKLGGFEVVDMRSGQGSATRTPVSSRTRGGLMPADFKSVGGRQSNQNISSMGNGSNATSSRFENTTGAINNSKCLPMPSQRLQAAYITNLMDNKRNNDAENAGYALKYLTETRGLTKQTLRKYGVGLGTYNFPSNEPGQHNRYVKADCVTFPWIMRASEVHEQEVLRGGTYKWNREEAKDVEKQEAEGGNDDSLQDVALDTDAKSRELIRRERGPFVTRRLKARALDNKSWQRLDPPGGGWGLFGWHTIPSNAKEVVLTEGEYDAMAVYQATGRPTVSLPNGCRSLPVEVLPMLERFDTIYLWMDSDAPGREGAEQFAKKIGINRCFLVQPKPSLDGTPPPKDANEALLKGMDLEQCINDAKNFPHDRILTFSELRLQVLDEIMNPEKNAGVPVKTLPEFTKLIKGFRRGEVTVLTGPTGSGKTTFLGQLSIDFAEQKVNTLWGSFEIKNTRLMQKLLTQFSREGLPKAKEDKVQALENLADRFEELPLYFMKFHGGSDVDDVLDAMEYAAYVHDVQHIILDNLQFMISRNGKAYGSSFDKFDDQDIAVEKFRKFATEKNVHVTLVVHPRKEDENAKLGMSSIYGSAKATQEADTVLILQYDGKKKFIEVKKNRFDGALGTLPLYFQHDSSRYSEQPDASIMPKKIQRTTRPGSSQPGRIRASPPISPTWDSILE